MAAYRDARDGRWRYRKWVRLPDGSKVRIAGTPTDKSTKQAAEVAEQEHIARVRHPEAPTAMTSPRKEVPRFKEFAEEFMQTYVKSNNKPSEQALKRVLLDAHLLPAFGAHRLDGIGVREIEALKARLLDDGKRKRKPKSVNNVLGVLGRILRYAVEVDVLEKAPKVKLLKVPPQKFDFLDDAEYERLRAAARAEPVVHAAILAAADAGLRRGEVLALSWDDVDLRAGRLVVRHSEWNGIVTSPKGGRARTLSLTPRLTAALKGIRHLGKRVFVEPDGTRWTRKLIQAGLSRACRRAGLRRIGWHPLRHTFCSHLAMRGVPPKVIQELAGHANLSTTMRYMHLAPRMLDDAILLLETRSAWSGLAESQATGGQQNKAGGE